MAVIALGAIVMYQFGFNALANTDAGVNLSDSPSYQQQYNITGIPRLQESRPFLMCLT